jgi:hypothetical protein
MNITARLLSAALLLSGCAVKHQPSLYERHIEARGGRATLEGLKVVERIGTFTFHGMSPAATGTYHTCVRYSDRAVIDIDAGPVQVHQVLGEHGPLQCDASFTSCTPATPDVITELQGTAQIANREELEKAPPTDARPITEGPVQVGYRYTKGDRVVEEEYSPDTGLLRRIKSGSKERHYADYRDAGGVLIPMSIEDYHDNTKMVSIALTSASHSQEASAWCKQRFAAKAN